MAMKVEKLYIYPVKSLRGIEVPSARATRFGFTYDRHFILLKVGKDDNGKRTTDPMLVANFNELVRFFPEFIDFPDKYGEERKNGKIKITHKPIDASGDRSIEFPLAPDVNELQKMDITLHRSPTQAHAMQPKYSEWFSKRLGYEVVLAYLGENRRKVLMSTEGHRRTPAAAMEGEVEKDNASAGAGWLSSTLSSISSTASSLVGLRNATAPEITFADVAPYLVVSSKSMVDVDAKLNAENHGEKEHFDITKFRPNIVVEGASEPWEEDFWGELNISRPSPKTPDQHIVLKCESNCPRCKSINVDFETGKPGQGEAGKMLKKLSVDRRVDAGAKYNPVFGRYCFLRTQYEGEQVAVGDNVAVTSRYKERTRFGKSPSDPRKPKVDR